MSNLSIVPIRAYFDTRLQSDDLLLLGVLCGYTDEDGYCFPSLAVMSKTFSPLAGRAKVYDDSTVSKKLNRLEGFGYLRNPRQRKNKVGGFSSNQYKVLYDAVLPLEFDRRQNQTASESASVENQTVLESANEEMQTNDPIERPSFNDPECGEAKPASRAPKERKAKIAKPTPLAVGVFREERNRFPPGRWYAEIDAAVGVEPCNLELWRQILHAWEGNGWNPLAVRGPLDYFARREIPSTKPKKSATYSKPTMLDNYAEAQRILEDVKNGKRDGDAGIVADIFSSLSGTSAQAEGFGGFDSDVGSGPG